MQNKRKVAVIGGGPSGIYLAYALSSLGSSTDFQIFERQSEPGGQWVFNPNPTDKYGLPTHSAVYDHLFTNSPKEALEIPIYPFPPNLPSYLTRQQMSSYILGFMDCYDLAQYIKCGTFVQNISFKQEIHKFELTRKDLETGDIITSLYDYVIVATGHFFETNCPTYPGQESFPGKIIHSRHFKNEVQFKGQQVAVIGGSYSADDISLQCYKFGAKKVTLVNRGKTGLNYPIGIQEKSNTVITEIEGSKLKFSDGSEGEYDAIIKATGFKHSFPFLEASLKLNMSENLFNPPLYYHVVLPERPQLFYIGMENLYYTTTLLYLQALMIANMIEGKVKIPSKEDMNQWIAQDAIQAKQIASFESKIQYQTNYLKKLCLLVEQNPAYYDFSEGFLLELKHIGESSVYFKDQQFKSLVSGKLSEKPEMSWIHQGENSRKEPPQFP